MQSVELTNTSQLPEKIIAQTPSCEGANSHMIAWPFMTNRQKCLTAQRYDVTTEAAYLHLQPRKPVRCGPPQGGMDEAVSGSVVALAQISTHLFQGPLSHLTRCGQGRRRGGGGRPPPWTCCQDELFFFAFFFSTVSAPTAPVLSALTNFLAVSRSAVPTRTILR